MNAEAGSLAALFASSFLSATLLPGNSEIVLAAVVAHLPHRLWAAGAVATVLDRATPFISQTENSPPDWFCQRRSGLASPLRSATPFACHPMSVTRDGVR